MKAPTDWVTPFLESYDRLDSVLISRGFPGTSPWWRAQLERWLRTGIRTFVLRVGRRGGKSSTLSRFAVCWALWGPCRDTVPPGDAGVVAFVSVSRDESAQRLRLIKSVLTALSVASKPIDGGVEIAVNGRPVLFKTFAASITGVSGFTSILFIGDEVAKYRDSESGANPAREVIGSARPTMATQQHARMLLCSSAFSTLDYHNHLMTEGDSESQLTAEATTWEANPTITEADTRALEKDPKIWAREFANIPQGANSAAFDADLVQRAFRPPTTGAWWQPIAVIDASSGGGDSFSWGICGYVQPDPPHADLMTVFHDGARIHPDTGQPLDMSAKTSELTFWRVDAFDGRFRGTITASEIIRRIAQACRQTTPRITTVVGDQREAFFVASEFANYGIQFRETTYTNASKIDAVRRVREHLAAGTLVLPEGREKLKKELLNYSERITSSGAITYGGRGSGHDDEAALVITAAMAELERHIPGSPFHYSPGRYEAPGR